MCAKVLTNYMLRKKLYEVNQQSRNIQSISNSNSAGNVEDDQTLILNVTKIIKVKAEHLILEDGRKALMFNPLPCLTWVCRGVVNADGVIILEKPLEALVLEDSDNLYIIGVLGESAEFELVAQVGENVAQINNEYININTKHLIKNGLEDKEL